MLDLSKTSILMYFLVNDNLEDTRELVCIVQFLDPMIITIVEGKEVSSCETLSCGDIVVNCDNV